MHEHDKIPPTFAWCAPVLIALAMSCGTAAEVTASPAPHDVVRSSAGEGEGEGEGTVSDHVLAGVDLFAQDHVLDISITMQSSDWTALAGEVPPQNPADEVFGPACLPQNNPGFAYATFTANVTIDGTAVDDVGIRKRDWCGSQSTTKPSLKLDFNDFVAHRDVGGLHALGLNNSVQDASLVRTCLAFEVFADAGLPASKCGFAHVVVNGRDMGIYVNVEHVDGQWLDSHFDGDKSGNLYKGFLGDFTSSREPFLFSERGDGDRSDIDAVSAAIASGDIDAVEGLVDLDEFDSEWAAELLVGHVDGYSGNTNNFYVYHRKDGKLVVIPWGPDTTFGTFGAPTFFASAVLPQLLAQDSKQLAAFQARVTSLLSTAWDEAKLDAEADRMAALVGTDASLVAPIHQFIDARRAQLEGQ
jgi:hypothetical protein